MSKKYYLLLFQFFLVIFCFFLITPLAVAKLSLPQPQGFVNDFAGLLSSQTVATLEEQLGRYEKKTSNEVVVVTVPDLQGTTIEDFAVRLFEKWGIGKKGKDNGILLLIARRERKIRIEVGYGLEPVLTDLEAYGIIVNNITPKFKSGDFDGGVVEGVNQIIRGLSGVELPKVEPASKGGDEQGSLWLALGLIGGFLFFTWIGAILARSKSWWAGGALGFVIGLISLLFIPLALGILAIIALTLIGLLFDYIVSRNYHERRKQGRKPAWWAGGSWGPGSFDDSSGSGFGGFGGGSSGGGGASGGW
jgi:uncharacterized protein